MESYKLYKDKESRKAYNRLYQKKYREKMKALGKPVNRNAGPKVRQKVIDFLGGPICVNCGCTDIRILEINHINGGGRREHKVKPGLKIYRDIYLGRSPKEEFNILCKVCNIQHYVEILLGIKGHKVAWVAQ